ncbi:hypothetical protein Kpol_1008p3 [Vanderwaltozyma polyspora DSM 70294]|uniref:TLC domain-containing protein n=1 Tax=Vanderwaltozyma polyspora (strain ATCC 22028 / DSM 70294 / BCRC 21397 / CBS 2163 / NBRC 10782 / NRRL Y-8283 / UCD 57-17) TaxID=436907 RepID=A7TPW9_VANPO|nr:uncharacterized protein Kpol_1008p3 [Vanderwaltozyma polyspora DSM 70294]EDO15667.1 hypothetical protein Kpol_1008p3 [Vanderwaltozyma polyspora DSM 70294]
MIKEVQVIGMDDPFMGYSWFPGSDSLYLSHLHEIVYSFVAYTIIYNIVSPVVNRVIFGHYYTHLSSRTDKIDFDIHTVSMFQCIVSLILAPLIVTVPKTLDVSNYYDHLCTLTSAVSLGYFIWDICVCILHYEVSGPAFFAHAIISIYMSAITIKPLFQPWIGAFLLFEASTPFVNVNWYLCALKKISKEKNVSLNLPTWINSLNGLVLMFIFLTVRLIWGTSCTIALVRETIRVKANMPPIPTLLFLVFVISLNLLNIYWFSKMIKIAMRAMNGTKSTNHTNSSNAKFLSEKP